MNNLSYEMNICVSSTIVSFLMDFVLRLGRSCAWITRTLNYIDITSTVIGNSTTSYQQFLFTKHLASSLQRKISRHTSTFLASDMTPHHASVHWSNILVVGYYIYNTCHHVSVH